ncbi:MAG TPA: alpha/beta fold hydrolase [Acidimicrobiia bacterium]|nr:alpha/beta fold hydrolase [Acidimicrobiia bacterium]
MSDDGQPIVLVHGGGHGAWCWEPLLPWLRAPVLAVDLPPKEIRGAPLAALPPEITGLGLDDFAAAVLADADAAGFERFVLVGHSMGGLTIAEVAGRAPSRVAHLVFVSCLVPPEGGSSIEALSDELQDSVRHAVAEARAGSVALAGLDEATVRQMFCNDMDEAQTAFVLAHVGVEAPAALADRVTRRGVPPTLPKTYVRLRRDQALAPAQQDAQIGWLRESPGGRLEVVDVDAGHDVMISAPALLAPIVNGVARDAARARTRAPAAGS